MLGMNVHYFTKGEKGEREALVRELSEAGLVDTIRAEDGCQQYDFYCSNNRENEILLMEKWENKDKHAAHRTAPHMSECHRIMGKYIIDASVDKYEL